MRKSPKQCEEITEILSTIEHLNGRSTSLFCGLVAFGLACATGYILFKSQGLEVDQAFRHKVVAMALGGAAFLAFFFAWFAYCLRHLARSLMAIHWKLRERSDPLNEVEELINVEEQNAR